MIMIMNPLYIKEVIVQAQMWAGPHTVTVVGPADLPTGDDADDTQRVRQDSTKPTSANQHEA